MFKSKEVKIMKYIIIIFIISFNAILIYADTTPVTLTADALEYYSQPTDLRPVTLTADILEYYYIPTLDHPAALTADILEYYSILDIIQKTIKQKQYWYIIKNQISRRRLR